MTKKIVVTGANGGFGKLTVETLLSKGYHVVGTMRAVQGKNKEIAIELKKKGAEIIEMDITDDKSVEESIKKATTVLGGIHVLVNLESISVSGMQEHFTPTDLKNLFEINFFGVQRVNRAVLTQLRAQNSGLIVHVASLLGRVTLPFYGPYNASMWALEALAENYRTELASFGVDSCIVEPGGYPTAFMNEKLTPSDKTRNEAYGDLMTAPKVLEENYERIFRNNPAQNPQKVADAIVKLIETPYGKRPLRTIVDSLGMGEPIKTYNEQLHKITKEIHSNFGIDDLMHERV